MKTFKATTEPKPGTGLSALPEKAAGRKVGERVEAEDVNDDPSEESPDPTPPSGESAPATEGDEEQPEIKRLHDEAARHRMTAKAERERADKAEAALQPTLDALRETRVELAFYREAKSRFHDNEAAFRLLNIAGINITEDEESWSVDGLESAIEHVADRYPYLLAEETPKPKDEKVRPDPVSPSGSPLNAGRTTSDGLDRARLEKLFPALRRR